MANTVSVNTLSVHGNLPGGICRRHVASVSPVVAERVQMDVFLPNPNLIMSQLLPVVRVPPPFYATEFDRLPHCEVSRLTMLSYNMTNILLFGNVQVGPLKFLVDVEAGGNQSTVSEK